MKKNIKRHIIFVLIFALLVSATGAAFAVNTENSQTILEINDYDTDSRSLARTYYYGATILKNTGGSFTYQIPYADFYAHSFWFVEFAGTTIYDQPITSRSGNLYAPNAVNIYFYYTD